MERFAAPVGAHAIHLHHHKTRSGEVAFAIPDRKRLGDEVVVRTGIDIFQHGARC